MSVESEPVLQCPKCQASMRHLMVEECVIDRCENCYGIWLDPEERVKLRGGAKRVDAIDIGPRDVGKEMDKITEIDCPRCAIRMAHKQHPDQRHVGFEECHECRGRFFDAGELADLAHFTIMDVVKLFTFRKS